LASLLRQWMGTASWTGFRNFPIFNYVRLVWHADKDCHASVSKTTPVTLLCTYSFCAGILDTSHGRLASTRLENLSEITQ
jgi:hypothetical protein